MQSSLAQSENYVTVMEHGAFKNQIAGSK